jgi:protein fate
MIFQIIEKEIFIANTSVNKTIRKFNFFLLKEKEDIPQNHYVNNEINKKIIYKLIGFISDSNYKNILQFIEKHKENSKYQKDLIYEILNNNLIKKEIKNKLKLYLNI